MILRGAQISERRLVLPAGSNSIPERSKTIDAKVESIGAAPQVMSAVSAARGMQPPVPEREERELTFESVVAWLAVQDQETRTSCAAILATEVAKTYEAAKREGFAAGRAAGEVAAQDDFKHLVTLFQEITVNAQTAFDQEQEQLQSICVEVVGEALAKIAGPLLASHEATVGAIREILKRVKESRELVIRVTHDDFDAVRKLESKLSDVLGSRKYEIVPDSRIELGGCIVETKLGSLDGRLEVQLRELYETLRLAKLSTPELP